MMGLLSVLRLRELVATFNRPSRQVNVLMVLLPLFSQMNSQDLLISCSKKTHANTCPAAVGTMAILKNSSKYPAAFTILTERIREDHAAYKAKRLAKNSKLGEELRRHSLVLAGLSARAPEENLPREVYLEGLTAAYPIFVIGLVLAKYGTDEIGEPCKVKFLIFFK